jgi:Tfp pilus assembly protein PilO
MFNLEKLKNIDLQNIDLKKINYNKLLAQLLERKDLFATLIVVCVGLIVAIGFLKNFLSETARLNEESKALQAKVELIATYNSSQSRIKKFIKSTPQALDEDMLSATITEISSHFNITIVSLVPGQKRQEDLYNTISVSIDLEIPNYQSFLQFLDAIYQSPYALRIDNCLVEKETKEQKMMHMNASSDKKKSDDRLFVRLDLSSVEIKK